MSKSQPWPVEVPGAPRGEKQAASAELSPFRRGLPFPASHFRVRAPSALSPVPAALPQVLSGSVSSKLGRRASWSEK